MIGKTFGRWTVIDDTPEIGAKHPQITVRCECGTEARRSKDSVVRGASKSCGCLKSEMMAARRLKHGATRGVRGGTGSRPAPEYNVWQNAKRRCYDPKNDRYELYGGRGIEMCSEWRDSFATFIADMGPRPEGRSLDRINANGNYEPGNCRWATDDEQRNNQRRSRLIEWQGRTLSLSQLAREVGLRPIVLHKRLKRGWPLEKAVTEPLKH